MDVSIIIVNYNTQKYIIDCISSIIEKTNNVDYEIIVSDNASTDNSIEEIQKRFPSVKIIENKSNLGFGLANNEGIKIAQGKYIFCLNPDTLLINNAVKILFDFMENNENCAAAGGNLYNKDLKPVHSFGYGDDIISLLLRKTFLKFLFLKDYLKIKNYEKTIDRTKINEVNHITGADLILKKSILDTIGYFSDKFFMYFEETELQTRIKSAGYKVYFVPESKIIHLESKSVNPKKSQYYYSSFVEYYNEVYGKAWGEIAKFLIRKKFF